VRAFLARSQRKSEDATTMNSLGTRYSSTDPIDLIAQTNRGRVPQLLQRKFDAMAADPFAFLGFLNLMKRVEFNTPFYDKMVY